MSRVGHLAGIVALTLVVASVESRPRGPIADQPTQTPRVRSLPPRDDGSRPVGTARIRGRVAAADTGRPLGRALVRAGPSDGRGTWLALTDADGRYELKDLPADRYIVSAEKAGFLRLAYGQRRPFEPARPLEVTDGLLVDRVDFLLPRGSVLAGHVVDEMGEPAARVVVQALGVPSFAGQARLVPAGRDETDDRGAYRIFGLPPGQYYLAASLLRAPWTAPAADSEERLGYAPTYYPGTANPADAQRIDLGLGQEIGALDFALRATRTVRVAGTVLDAEGRPPRGARVVLAPAASTPLLLVFQKVAVVRPDGSFVVPDVVPGEYVLRVSLRASAERDAEFAALPLSVGSEDVTGLVIATAPGARVNGRLLLDGPLPGQFRLEAVRVALVPEVSAAPFAQTGHQGQLQPDWTFAIRGVEGGRYLVRPVGVPAPWTLQAVLLNGLDITDTPLELKGGDQVDGLEVVLTMQTTEVTGTAVDERGRPVQDYVAILFADDPTRWAERPRFIQWARSDQDGLFRVRGLPPATYIAVAVDASPEGDLRDPSVLEQLRPLGTRLTLTAGATQKVTLKLATLP